MISRLLILLNSLGCVALVGVVVLQWSKERTLHAALDASRAELAQQTAKAAEQATQREGLERDIVLLKESLASTQQAAEAGARALGEQSGQTAALEAELKAARERITAWEAAIKARDERITALTADLAATRKRLDEAVARLKAAVRERKGGG